MIQIHKSSPLSAMNDDRSEVSYPLSEQAPYVSDDAAMVTEMRLRVLQGHFLSPKGIDVSHFPGTPSFELLVFVSSTFTDTKHERNILQEKVAPQLRLHAREHGVGLTLVDFRWGIRDESTKDNNTWVDCEKGLELCRKESAGLFFISLQSSKYGYCPLPKAIDQAMMDARIAALDVSRDAQAISAIREWYILDENCIPPAYVLKKREKAVGDTTFDAAVNAIGKRLDNLTFWPGDAAIISGRSVTEWETRAAMRSAEDAERCFWYHRELTDEASITDDWAFCDSIGSDVDVERKGILDKRTQLKTFMRTHVLSDNITDVSIAHADITNVECDAYKSYYDAFAAGMESVLSAEVDKLVEGKKAWDLNGHGMNIPGVDLEEMLHHCSWAREKVAGFYGRQDLVQDAINAINSFGRAFRKRLSSWFSKFCCLGDAKGVLRFSGLSLAVVGKSGAGKTALMAKLASFFTSETDSSRPVVIRFCGTSAGSLSGLDLMRSIIMQLNETDIIHP